MHIYMPHMGLLSNVKTLGTVPTPKWQNVPLIVYSVKERIKSDLKKHTKTQIPPLTYCFRLLGS